MAKVSDTIKMKFMADIKNFLEENGEEVLLVKSGTYSIPWTYEEEEGYINITFSIPKGAREGGGYSGHEDAQNYALEQSVKAAEKVKKDAAKAKKIARDAAFREKQKEEKKGKEETE